MKKNIFVALVFGFVICLLLLFSCNQQRLEGYIINGDIEGIDTGYVKLEFRGEGIELLECSPISNGKFVFKGSVNEPLYLRATVIDSLNNRYRFGFFVENSDIDVNYNINTGVLNVEGSDSGLRLDSIRAIIGQTNESLYDAAADYGNYYEYTYLVFEKLISDDWKKLQYLVSRIDKSLENTHYIKIIKSEIERAKNLEPGGMAPNFKMVNIKGDSISLENYRGKYLVLDFGASWCPDCMKEQNGLIGIYNKFHSKGLEVLNIALEDDDARWHNWYEKYDIPYVSVSDLKGWGNDVAVLYNIRWLPTYYLIDKKGVIVGKATELDRLKDLLEKSGF